MRLRVDGDLDLAATLYSGQAFRWGPSGDGWHDGFILNAPVRVRAHEGALEVDSAGGLTAADVRNYFRLDGSHDAFLRRVRRDAVLERAIAACPGLRLLRQDPWEVLVGFILSQNSNEPRIRQTVEALAALAGRSIEWRGVRRHCFPTPRRLDRVGVAALRGAGLGYRAEYVRQAASATASGAFDPYALARLAYQEAHARLTALAGVGPKVADCVLLYGCGHLSAFPADVWIRRVVAENYYRGPNKTPPYSWIRAFALERFGPEAGYAQHLLFHWRRRLQTSAVAPI